MTVILIGKAAFSSSTFPNCKSIAYDSTTRNYTITKADNTTATYSSDSYYVSILWN